MRQFQVHFLLWGDESHLHAQNSNLCVPYLNTFSLSPHNIIICWQYTRDETIKM